MKHVVVIIFVGIFLLTQSFAQELELAGTVYDVNGPGLYMHCEGEGQTTIVIDAGMGEWSLHWLDTQAVLAEVTRVCVYDRDGYGASELSESPRDAMHAVEDLNALLTVAEFDEPIVLVGHSLGAAHARLFAGTYPERVMAVVFVDSPTPSAEAQRPESVIAVNDAEFEQFPTFAQFASNGFIPPDSIEPPAYLPENHVEQYQQQLATEGFFTALYGEYQAWDETMEQVEAVTDLGDIPVLVIGAEFSDPISDPNLQAEWDAFQRDIWLPSQQDELMNLSTDGRFILAEGSGHHVQFDAPDVLHDSILELLEDLRS